MKCPFCGKDDQRVLDSRPARDNEAIRRRRECTGCGRRFTTFEQPEIPRLFVVKRDGSRQEFRREKVLNSILLACGKRPISIDKIESVAEGIEQILFRDYDGEVPSSAIGEAVMEALQALDTVAYVRYASVYREFETVNDFSSILKACRPVVTKHENKIERQAAAKTTTDGGM